jgi:hypothetical protein
VKAADGVEAVRGAVDVGGRSKEKDDEEIKMFSSQAKCSSLIFLLLI